MEACDEAVFRLHAHAIHRRHPVRAIDKIASYETLFDDMIASRP
jgi:hypothetical protein